MQCNSLVRQTVNPVKPGRVQNQRNCTEHERTNRTWKYRVRNQKHMDWVKSTGKIHRHGCSGGPSSEQAHRASGVMGCASPDQVGACAVFVWTAEMSVNCSRGSRSWRRLARSEGSAGCAPLALPRPRPPPESWGTEANVLP